MTLPAPGSTISMSQINTELGRTSTLEISLDTAENGGYATINTCSPVFPQSPNPASMSEWWSYNHTALCICPLPGYNYSLDDTDCFDVCYTPDGALGNTDSIEGECAGSCDGCTQCTATKLLSVEFQAFNAATYIRLSDGTNCKRWYHANATDSFVTQAGSCETCPATPAPTTPAPTTPAPTTPAPTPNPTPSPTTPAPTTPAPTTPAPTTPSPTPAPTLCEIGALNYSNDDTDCFDVCYTPDGAIGNTDSIAGDGCSMCASTIMYSVEFQGFAGNTYIRMSDGTGTTANCKRWYHASASDTYVTQSGGCSTCPATPAPTPNPTPNPTPQPTTPAPTTPAPTTPSPTPQPTTPVPTPQPTTPSPTPQPTCGCVQGEFFDEQCDGPCGAGLWQRYYNCDCSLYCVFVSSTCN